MNTKNNRQFKSSDVRMKQAVLELMDTLPFERITVRLICERAGVNRSTFYAHYTDIYDMMGRMEANLHSQLMAGYSGGENTVPLSLSSLITFLQFIRTHRYFYRAALKARREFPLKQGFEPLWEQVVRPLSLKAGITSEQEMLYYFVGFQAGFTMILRRWVEQGCVESEEQIARIVRNSIPSVWRQP